MKSFEVRISLLWEKAKPISQSLWNITQHIVDQEKGINGDGHTEYSKEK